MYYHASPFKDIKELEPRVSNHNIPLIYFSDKRENVLIYLSNAVEKYCKENNYNYSGIYSKWGPYSFKEGIMQIEEYYPNFLYETYKGVSGYIYYVKDVPNIKKLDNIDSAYVTDTKTIVYNVEYILDAYDEIIKEVNNNRLKIIKYEDFIKSKKDWLEKTIKDEYQNAIDHPEYRFFLENKFNIK